MDFFMVGIGLWGLMIVSGLLLIYGLWKKSWVSLFISGIASLVPFISLATQKGWFGLFILIPLFIFGLALYLKKET